MYVQPYEPQDTTFGASGLGGYGASQIGAPGEVPMPGDGVSSMLPWSETMPGFSDGASALNDGPFGALGLGSMLTNLTGMMQQLVQMMQSLLGHGNSSCTHDPHARRFPEQSGGEMRSCSTEAGGLEALLATR